jgi:mono/diheme cytochrome c family protein
MTRSDALLRAARAAMLAMAFAAPAALGQPAPERGRALYETRCIACHEKSVHQREARRAADFASLRREVERWSTTIGGEWRAEELDAVTIFLNDRYYRFACPPTVCRDPARAGAPARAG